jgi:predicted PurR-regulated permease PerM
VRAVTNRDFRYEASSVSEESNETAMLEGPTKALVISVIRIGALGLLAYWCLILVEPFMTIVAWSIVFAVALYPVFVWTAVRLSGHRALAAAAITIVSLLVILGPATWLGLSLIGTLRFLIDQFGDGSIVVPPPPDAVKSWPLIGETVYETWYLASTNLKALLLGIAPQLKSLGGSLLGAAGSTGLNILKFIVAVVVSGFLFIPGPALAQSAKKLLHLVAAKRGEEFIDLAGATIRNVSRGVIGVSVLQTLLVGIGLMVAGVPAAGLLSFLVLLLGIVQFPSLILAPLVIWSWITMETTAALLFSAYMVPVSLLDNILRPLVMAQGLNVPLPVILIGVIGGTLAHGVIGLFVGPIVLSVAWQLLIFWLDEATDGSTNEIDVEPRMLSK